MSHFTRCTTKFARGSTLVRALEKVGGWAGKVEVHATPVPLYGYEGNEREETAHIVIRRQHVGGSSNDIGFLRREDGTYEAIISEFDARSGHGKNWVRDLTRTYQEMTIEEIAAEHGYQLESVEDTTEGRQLVYVTS